MRQRFPALLMAALCIAAPAAAQSVVAVPGLRMGVIAGGFSDPAIRLEPFRKRLAAGLGMAVTLVPLRGGAGLVDALSTGRIDYAVLSASAYAQADRACRCVEPLARPRGIDGDTAWRSVLAVRADSPLAAAGDLKGAVVAAAPEPSFAGRAFPLAALQKDGVVLATAIERLDTAAGIPEALKAVGDGRADAALAWQPVAEDGKALAAGPLTQAETRRMVAPGALKVIWMSPPVPNGAHVVRSALPVETRTKLREILVHLQEDDAEAYEAVEPDRGGGLRAAARDGYEGLAAILAAPPPSLK